MMRKILFLLMVCFAWQCQPSAQKKDVPTIGFLDFIDDPTIALAKNGFFDALDKNGFSEKAGTITVEYANAHGDIPVLGQACDLLISKNPTLLASNITLPTITAVKRTTTIPVFMMVAPRPDIAGLTDAKGKAPANLFGVYETLDYLDTAVTLIKKLRPETKTVGTIYNPSEPQAVDAYEKIKAACEREGMKLEMLPVNNSSETQLVVESLLAKHIDVFFALPVNVIFESFEIVLRSCDKNNVPIFTSEAGLVLRGAVASFGADFYQWGYQSGLQAAQFLKTGKTDGLSPEIVSVRSRVYNPEHAKMYNITPGNSFQPYIKP